MKIELEDLRIGLSPMTGKVYAGVLEKDGHSFKHKIDITEMFTAVAISKWKKRSEDFEDSDGNTHTITILKNGEHFE